MLNLHEPARFLQRELQRLGEALAPSGGGPASGRRKFRDKDRINHRINIMTFISIQHYFLTQRLHLTVYHHALVSLTKQVIQHLIIFALSTDNHRCINSDTGCWSLDAGVWIIPAPSL